MDKKLDRKQKDELLSRTVPSRQKQAKEYLQGRSPGTMQRYAPDAHADRREGWVESEETVRDLALTREALKPPLLKGAVRGSGLRDSYFAVSLLFALRVKRSLSTIYRSWVAVATSVTSS